MTEEIDVRELSLDDKLELLEVLDDGLRNSLERNPCTDERQVELALRLELAALKPYRNGLRIRIAQRLGHIWGRPWLDFRQLPPHPYYHDDHYSSKGEVQRRYAPILGQPDWRYPNRKFSRNKERSVDDYLVDVQFLESLNICFPDVIERMYAGLLSEEAPYWKWYVDATIEMVKINTSLSALVRVALKKLFLRST